MPACGAPGTVYGFPPPPPPPLFAFPFGAAFVPPFVLEVAPAVPFSVLVSAF